MSHSRESTSPDESSGSNFEDPASSRALIVRSSQSVRNVDSFEVGEASDASSFGTSTRIIFVEVCSARALMPKDGTGSSSPFCIIEFDGDTRRTSVKANDLNPIWNEMFSFPIPHSAKAHHQRDARELLEINVLTSVREGGKQTAFLGRLRIPVSFYGETEGLVPRGQESLQWRQLEKRGIFSHVSGQLGIKLSFMDTNALAGSDAHGLSAIVQADPYLRTLNPGPGPEPDEVQSQSYQQNLAYDLVNQVEYLFVKVVQARSLLGKDVLNGTSSPYARLALGHLSPRTRTIPRELNPVWRQVFAFALDQVDGETGGVHFLLLDRCPLLELSVWDEDRFGPDIFLGQVTLPTKGAPRRSAGQKPAAAKWHKLQRRSGGKRNKVKGDIQVAVWIGTQSDDEFAEAWQSDTGGVAHFRSRLYYAPKLWYLRVIIIEAEGLVLAENRRLPELIVKVRLGGQKRQTEVAANKGSNPLWNEGFLLVASEPFEDILHLDIVDIFSMSSEDLMGQVKVHLHQIQTRLRHNAPVSSRWLTLIRPGRYQAPCGRLKVRLCFEGGYHVTDESNNHSSSTEPSAKELWGPPIGQLELGLIGAKGLAPMKVGPTRVGTTDAYAVAKYSDKWVRTRTVRDDYHPRWNEQYTWNVYEPCTVLTVGVFDNRHLKNSTLEAAGGAKDQPIGKVRIRLNALQSNRIYTNAHPLLLLTRQGVKKMGELELAIRFTCKRTLDITFLYVKPPLPVMHYVQPIEAKEKELLRVAAMTMVAGQLARCEPPLRAEVVHFMLDTDENMFSMRRIKANMFRIKAVMAVPMAIVKWAMAVRTWEHPPTTLLVHVLYAFLIYYPELVLPAILLYVALLGILKHQRRPQTPPFMDEKLSQGEEMEDADELEEEMDQAPAMKNKEATLNPVKYYRVLKGRYERLKSVAAEVQTWMGVAASYGERVQALLSWRDPRATTMFVVGCLLLAGVLYLLPIQPTLLVAGWWALRHPRLRKQIPTKAACFLNRLPSLADTVY